MNTLSAVSTPFDVPSFAPAALPEAYVFGELRVLTGLDLLLRGDCVVPLEPRAVRVLRHLVRHAGRVVAKEELLDEVWPDTYVTEGVLKKAVSQIRRALDDPPQQSRFIETYHRRGYRFIAPVEGAARQSAGVGVGPTTDLRQALQLLARCESLLDAVRTSLGVTEPLPNRQDRPRRTA